MTTLSDRVAVVTGAAHGIDADGGRIRVRALPGLSLVAGWVCLAVGAKR